MPAVFDPAFARWLTQHGEERAQAVNVLQFSHPRFGDKYVSDYGDEFRGKEFTATDENGVEFTAQPLGFQVDRSSDNLTTEQRLLFRLDNANGLVTQELRQLDEEDLQTPVELIYRVYLDTRRGAPAYDPVRLFVTNTNATRLVVECEASAEQMPNVRAGIRYTLERFPTLVYL